MINLGTNHEDALDVAIEAVFVATEQAGSIFSKHAAEVAIANYLSEQTPFIGGIGDSSGVVSLEAVAIRLCQECDENGIVYVDSMTMVGVYGGWMPDRCMELVHRLGQEAYQMLMEANEREDKDG